MFVFKAFDFEIYTDSVTELKSTWSDSDTDSLGVRVRHSGVREQYLELECGSKIKD